MNLRKAARGQPCLVRIPGYCNHDPATTVLAHIRLAGITGVGKKAPDLLGAWACSTCHDLLDGRLPTELWSPHELSLMFYEGVIRTIAALIAAGKVKV